MKVVLRIKQEMSDSETDYSSDVSNASHSDSVEDSSPNVSANGDSVGSLAFANFEGVHTGVPTRTTPTLTPTTLRNIEQTFIELQRETERAEPHHHEAGFVPPVVEPVNQTVLAGKTLMSLAYSKDWTGGIATITTAPANSNSNSNSNSSQSSQGSDASSCSNPRPTVVSSAMSLVQPVMLQSTRRNVGGRRPNKNTGISPEEEERRRVRRERNKMAAARCRKRRLDHTNELQKETEGLEHKRQLLQNEIKSLQTQKEELSFFLQAHQVSCRLTNPAASVSPPPSPPDIKPIIYHEENDIAPPKIVIERRKPSRPSSLPVTAAPVRTAPVLEVAGVPITTPSAGIPFNFDSLMDGGTGLTPVGSTGLTPMIPSCSSQQRSSGSLDLASPDASLPPKLVSL